MNGSKQGAPKPSQSPSEEPPYGPRTLPSTENLNRLKAFLGHKVIILSLSLFFCSYIAQRCQQLRVTIRDGRVFIGKFGCIDSDRNVVLREAWEFRTATWTKIPEGNYGRSFFFFLFPRYRETNFFHRLTIPNQLPLRALRPRHSCSLSSRCTEIESGDKKRGTDHGARAIRSKMGSR